MNIFTGCELAFGNAYFSTKRQILKVRRDSPVQTLSTSTDVPPCAGSFAFPEDELGLHNRFIIWRSDGQNLHLDEFSAKRDLTDSAITINFPQSTLIPETKFFMFRGTLIIAVPTQSGVHSFCFQLTDVGDPQRRLTVSRSIFGLIRTVDELEMVHEFHAFKPTTIATKISFGLTAKTGELVAAVCTTDLQLVRVTLPEFVGSGRAVWDEVLIHGSSMFNRLFKGKNACSDTADSLIISGPNGEMSIFSVHRDGAIRCWGPKAQSPNFTENIAKYLDDEVESSITKICMKSARLSPESDDVLVFNLTIGNFSRFILLKPSHNSLELLTQCELNTKYVTNFICVPAESSAEDFCLWTVLNDTTYVTDADGATYFQPYALKKFNFSSETNSRRVWDEVQSDILDSKLDSSLINFPEADAIRNRIFDGNSYSFSVVERAMQVVCKQPKGTLYHNDWVSLSQIASQFVNTGQFRQIFLSNEEQSFIRNMVSKERMQVVVTKYWQSLLRCCSQMQEDDLKPLGFLHSPALGLFGIIQVTRIAVYLPPDEHMLSICEPNNEVVKALFRIIEEFLKLEEDEVLTKMNCNETLETIVSHTDEFGRIIEAFAEHRPVDVTGNLASTNAEYFASSFSTGYLGAAIRRRIMGRLRFADIISKLISTIPKILAISTEARISPKLEMVISTYNNVIIQIVQYYTIMYISLSVQLMSKTSSTDQNAQRQYTVAQAYFKYGSQLVKVLPDFSEKIYRRLQDYGEDEEDSAAGMELSREEDASMVSGADASGVAPPSRWERSSFYGGKKKISSAGSPTPFMPATPTPTTSTTASTVPPTPGFGTFGAVTFPASRAPQSFAEFARDALAGAIVSLWPESVLLTLPRFLAQNGFHDALRNYCSLLHNPPKPELYFGIHFFQAIAFSGLGQLDAAWEAFVHTAGGVEKKDDVLNQILSTLNAEGKERKPFNSLADYWGKVMMIFKSQERHKYVVKAAEEAIEHATNKKDPALGNVYTTIFMQLLAQHEFGKAMRCVLRNPSEKLQAVCLRQLLRCMIEYEDTKTLVRLDYGPLTRTVADILDTRCYGSATGMGPEEMRFNVAFSYHMLRFDYGRAAKIMYDFALRLAKEIQSREILQKRCKILAVVFQTLEFAFDPAVIVCRVEKDDREDQFKNALNSKEIQLVASRDELAPAVAGVSPSGTQPSTVMVVALTRSDIGREMMKTEARLDLLDADPGAIPPLQSTDIVRELIKHKKYDVAWVIVCEFALPLYELLEVVTKEALVIDIDESKVDEYGDLPLWTYYNRKFILPSLGMHKTHWKIVISYVDLALYRSPGDSRVLRTVAYTFLKYSMRIPPWLSKRYKQTNFGDFLRTLIDFDELHEALTYLSLELDAATAKVMTGKVKSDLDALLPFTHIDELMRLAKKANNHLLPVQDVLSKLRKFFNCYEIARRGGQMT